MEFVVQCEKCGKCFSSHQALASHIRWIHETPSHQCNVCLKTFRDAYALKRHVNAMHVKNNPRGSYKVCPDCKCKIDKKNALEHFRQHGYTMETETLKFIDSATFEQWKTKIEKETNSKFVKKCGPRTVQKDIIRNKYCCHRSGHFKSNSQGVRTLKVLGSNKIDAYCPASIVTKSQPSGEVIVTIQKTHVGHEKEVGRLSLTKEEKAEFASKIAMGVPLEDILDAVGTSIEGTLCRRDLTTRKDLHNIIQLYNFNSDDVLHSEDYISLAQTRETDSAFEERKAVTEAKFSEMMKSIKTTAGLEALERHLAPLPFIINSAEEKSIENFQQVSVMQEPPNKKLTPQRKFFSTKKPVAKKSKLSNPKRSECYAIAFSMVTGMTQDCTL